MIVFLYPLLVILSIYVGQRWADRDHKRWRRENGLDKLLGDGD